MKKNKALILLLTTLFLLLSTNGYSTSAENEAGFQNKAVTAFLAQNNINSLDEYILWLKDNIAYQQEEKDSWSSPSETLEKRYGDCEDLSFLNAEVLRIFGYQPQVVAYGKNNYAHVICLFKKDGFYQLFDNNRIVKTNAKKFEQFPVFFATKAQSTHFFELNYDQHTFKILYTMKVNKNV